jgi:hypothetical protein
MMMVMMMMMMMMVMMMMMMMMVMMMMMMILGLDARALGRFFFSSLLYRRVENLEHF